MNNGHFVRIVRPVACVNCPELPHCGGRDGGTTLDMAGCWDLCAHPDGCRTKTCRWTCPFNEPAYTRRVLDVGGDLAPIYPQLLPVQSEAFASYVPRLMTGVRAATRRPLRLSLVAISLFEAVGFIRSNSSPIGLLRPAFHAHYGLGLETGILLLGVARDSSLEGYWHVHREKRVLDGLRQLNLVGITVPDFSFFTDIPRPDSLRNRKRMLLVAQRLSEAEIPVIPHFNAGNDFDWKVWAELLRRNPKTTTFAKEFQTGHRRTERVREATEAIARLQDAVGRPLHPLLVSGFKAVKCLAPLFTKISVLDTMPCMKALKFKKHQSGVPMRQQWAPSDESPSDCLASLIEENVASYSAKVQARILQSRTSPSSCSDLTDSWRRILSPRRTNRPLVFGHAPWKSESTEAVQLTMLDQPASLTS